MAQQAIRIGLSGCAGGLEAVSTRALLDLAERAEALGFEGLWLNEEHFQGGLIEVEGRRCLSPLILAAAILARTTRIRVGFSVLLLALHQPIRLAEEIATLDVLSDGRVDFGVSRGGNPRYLGAYGVEKDKEGLDTHALLQPILQAWRPGQMELGGSMVSVEPKPVQQPHPPVYVGTYTEATAAQAARAGHRLITHGITTPEKAASLIAAYAGAGGDVTEAPYGRFVFVAQSDAEARQELWPTVLNLTERLRGIAKRRSGLIDEAELEPERFYRRMVIAGSPDTVAARIGELRDTLGVTYFNGLAAFFGFLPEEPLMRSLELLATEVKPRLNRTTA